MSNKNSSFDFKNITGPKEKKKSPETSPKYTFTDEDIVIPIPRGSSFESVNLKECSGEDFLVWAQGVYPGDPGQDPSYFDNYQNRLRSFNNILHYHESSWSWQSTLGHQRYH